MHFLYNIGVFVYGILITIASAFNFKKAKEWKSGRKEDYKKWETIPLDKTVYWFHCASLGEFDQGDPIMHKLKIKDPSAFILVTFFSPSGMNHYLKRNHCVDVAYYLPLDTPSKAKEFILFFHPKVAYFVKYEFWANYIISAKKNGVKVFCVSALFRKKHIFFKWYGGFFRKILRAFDFIYVQNIQSKLLLDQIGVKNVIVSGDTRYDKVHKNYLSRIKEEDKNNVFNRFLLGQKAIIIGSSWPKEESLIISVIKNNPQKKFIIAPHDISDKHIKNITMELKECVVKYTEFLESEGKNCLLLDTIGHLSSAYYYGSMAFIGGGFSGRLHNILEPAVFGLPTFYGPNIANFPEAKEFIEHGIGFLVKDQKSVEKIINKIENNSEELIKQTKKFIESKIGATDIIYNHRREH